MTYRDIIAIEPGKRGGRPTLRGTRIAVADGVMAALGFFVMQGLLQLASLRFDLPPGQALLVAFVGAGSVVALVALLLFQQSGVPDLLRTVGLRLPRGSTWLSVARALALGIGTGLVAGADTFVD